MILVLSVNVVPLFNKNGSVYGLTSEGSVEIHCKSNVNGQWGYSSDRILVINHVAVILLQLMNNLKYHNKRKSALVTLITKLVFTF